MKGCENCFVRSSRADKNGKLTSRSVFREVGRVGVSPSSIFLGCHECVRMNGLPHSKKPVNVARIGSQPRVNRT